LSVTTWLYAPELKDSLARPPVSHALLNCMKKSLGLHRKVYVLLIGVITKLLNVSITC